MKGRDTPIVISVSSFLGFSEMLVGHYFELRPFGTEYVDSKTRDVLQMPLKAFAGAKVTKINLISK